MAHGQWSEVEARGVLGAWQRSGVSLERFAQQRGFTPQRLYWWKRKLGISKSKTTPSAPLTLLPVKVQSEPRRGEPVTVLLPTGQILKVSRGFDEEAFARVVALLERS